MHPTSLTLESFAVAPADAVSSPPTISPEDHGTNTFRCLADLLFAELSSLSVAEAAVRDALPQLRSVTHAPELRELFSAYERLAEENGERVDLVFAHLQRAATEASHEAVDALVRECQTHVEASRESAVRDVSLIAFAQRLLHIQMAGYGTARSFAEHLGWSASARLLQAALDATKELDRRFTQLAERQVNLLALHN